MRSRWPCVHSEATLNAGASKTSGTVGLNGGGHNQEEKRTSTACQAEGTASIRFTSPPRLSTPPRMVTLGLITPNNIHVLKIINRATMPVSYSEAFYACVIDNRELCRFALVNDTPVGAVCCRLVIEHVPPKAGSSSAGLKLSGPSTGGPSHSSEYLGRGCFDSNPEADVTFSRKEGAPETATDRLHGSSDGGSSNPESRTPILPITMTVSPPKLSDGKGLSAPPVLAVGSGSIKGGGGPVGTTVKLCVMTIAVLAAYRRMGIGRTLLEWVKEKCAEITKGTVDYVTGPIPNLTVGVATPVSEIYLHVWNGQQGGVSHFYSKMGFQKGEEIKNYYKSLNPPGCSIYRFPLTSSALSASTSATTEG